MIVPTLGGWGGGSGADAGGGCSALLGGSSTWSQYSGSPKSSLITLMMSVFSDMMSANDPSFCHLSSRCLRCAVRRREGEARPRPHHHCCCFCFPAVLNAAHVCLYHFPCLLQRSTITGEITRRTSSGPINFGASFALKSSAFFDSGWYASTPILQLSDAMVGGVNCNISPVFERHAPG